MSMSVYYYYADDTEFAGECHKAFVRGQQALDTLLWNETGAYYNAYTYNGKLNTPINTDAAHGGNASDKDRPPKHDPLGAIMTDTFYSQVCSK